MADSVKDLVVRLSFEHGDTKSQIAAIKNEIKLLDSGFKAAASAAGGFSDSLDESGARSQLLRQQIALQEQAIQKYGQAIEQAQQRLQAAQNRQADYAGKLEASKARHEELTKAIDAQKKALAEAERAGEAGSSGHQEMQQNLEQLQAALKENESEIRQWEKGLQKADTSIANADKSIQKLTIAQNESKAAMGQMQGELGRLNSSFEQHKAKLTAASEKLQAYSDAARSAGERQEQIGRTLSKGSAAIVGAGVAAVGAAISWEDAFAGVEKTVSGTDEQLANIERSLIGMSKVKPVDNNTLADIAANAGQLGIATDNVVRFTDVMSDLSATTNLSAEEGASAFAKFANITGMSQNNFDRLGSTVVELGNNMATTEKDIVSMATNLASAGSQIGMSEPEIMGISAALSSLGLEAQAGGTAFSKLFVNMQVAVETGNAKLKEFAAVAGMSAQEFAAAFQADAAGAVTQFISGLSAGSQSAIAMLDDMGITETRMRDALLRASNASELFAGSINMANSAWQENTALAAEASVRYGTTASKLTMAGNKAKAAAVQFGNDLLPAVTAGVDWIGNLLEKFNALDASQRQQIMTWAAYAAAVGPAIALVGKANSGIASVTGLFSKLTGAAAQAGGGLGGLMASVKSLLGPAGIAALAAGLTVGVYKFAEWATGAKAAREATEAMTAAAKEMRETQAETIYDTGTADPLARFGVSREAFTEATADSKQWLSELQKVWSDGKRETNEDVAAFVDGFTSASDDVRSAIESRGALLDGLGALSPETKAKMEADIRQLDSWDKEVAELLSKRQNGTLTDQDQARLNEVIELRAQLRLEYGGGENSYEQVIEGLQAEIARTLASGEQVDASAYGDALSALAQGRQAYLDSLNQSYDAQHAEIMAIEDETQRVEALKALNEQYNQQRLEGEQQYRDAAAQAAAAAFEQGGFDDQIRQIDELAALLGSGSVDLTKLADWTSQIDEGKMTSMLALVEQLRASGMSDSQLAELGIDADDLLSKIQQIRDATAQLEGGEGLHSIFSEALPDEVQRILVGLDMTQAAEDWAAFAEGKDPWSATGTMTLTEVDETALDNWKALNADAEITGPAVKLGVGLGADWTNALQAKLDAGLLAVYGADGVRLPATPEVLKQIGPSDVMMLGEDGTLHVIVTPEAAAGAGVNIRLNPLDSAAIASWEAANSGVELTGPVAKVGVTLGSGWATKLTEAMDAGLLAVYGADGKQIPVTPEVLRQIDVNDVAVVDTDGTLHVIVTPEVGSAKGVQSAEQKMNETPLDGTILSFMASSTQDNVDTIRNMADSAADLRAQIDALNASGEIWTESGLSSGELEQMETAQINALVASLQGLTDVDLANIGNEIMNLMAALSSGELDADTAQQYAQRLQAMLDVVGAADQYLGTGNMVSAGIAQGMNAYGWDGDAATLAGSIQAAVDGALGVASPATTMIPTGGFVSAGIGQGMQQYSFAADAQAVSQGIVGAFDALPAQGLQIGRNFGAGLQRGLQSRMSATLALARSYAAQITAAFRSAWQIHSPSRVAEGLTEMFGRGLEKGMEDWPSVSEAMLRQDVGRVHGQMQRGAESVDNRQQTYNQQRTTNINVDRMEVRDPQDVRDLALELNALDRRYQRGRGKW